MSLQHQCPNCDVAISQSAQICTACGASFAEGSAWKPRIKVEDEGGRPATAMNLVSAAVGVALLLATFFPIGAQMIQAATGGMYGPIFKPYSPALFILLSYTANYLPLTVLSWLLLRHFQVMDRVPYKYRGSKLFAFGVSLILFYSAARVFAATIPGGGAGFAVASFSPIIVFPALAVLVIAAIRLCVGYGKGAAQSRATAAGVHFPES